MSNEELQELLNHKASLRLGEEFRAAYNKGGSTDSNGVLDLLEKYKDARRKLSKDADGARFGAYDAYLSTQ